MRDAGSAGKDEAGATPKGRGRNLFARTVQELGARVVRGDYGVGGGLPIEPQLAAELGVSRNLLREAVKVLAGKGLLEVRPKSGMRVRPQAAWHLLDPDVLSWLDGAEQRLERAFDLCEFRLIIEPNASYLAALRASEAERRQIEQYYNELEECVGNEALVPERDITFHRSIHTASHNQILDHLGMLSSTLMRMQVLITTDAPGLFEKGLPLHRELTDAILKGDADAAEDASRRLVQMPYDDLVERRQRQGRALPARLIGRSKRSGLRAAGRLKAQ